MCIQGESRGGPALGLETVAVMRGSESEITILLAAMLDW